MAEKLDGHRQTSQNRAGCAGFDERVGQLDGSLGARVDASGAFTGVVAGTLTCGG